MFAGLPVDGIRCDSMEGALEHIHAHLKITDGGRALEIPSGIGIPQGGQCLYWLHTHSSDGLVHIESPLKKTFRLGQFFDIWGEPLSRTQAAGAHASRGHALRVTVNGKAWKGDPRTIPLRDHEEIVINGS
ncbi:MAG: hypothetical protein ABR508_07045 [Candidatus Baltobacteraceae bacterium]